MSAMMSACGVLCSGCPAYLGKEKGIAHQERTAEAWGRIYGLNEAAASITCGGCLGPDEGVFHFCRTCKARNCCRSQGLNSCAECSVKNCPDLEKAQAQWDRVPELAQALSKEDFATYAQPYCGHRQRLAEAREARKQT